MSYGVRQVTATSDDNDNAQKHIKTTHGLALPLAIAPGCCLGSLRSSVVHIHHRFGSFRSPRRMYSPQFRLARLAPLYIFITVWARNVHPIVDRHHRFGLLRSLNRIYSSPLRLAMFA